MRAREEIRTTGPLSGEYVESIAMENILEVLLDIRDLLEGLNSKISGRD